MAASGLEGRSEYMCLEKSNLSIEAQLIGRTNLPDINIELPNTKHRQEPKQIYRRGH
jgi:hypothetical protein